MEDLNSTLASLQLEDFASAKIKIDQLFVEWLSTEGLQFIDAILCSDDLLSSDDEGGLSCRNGDSFSGLSYGLGPIPPRSPTNTKKSPKKRTQSEMQNNTNSNISNNTSLSLAAENSKSTEGLGLAGVDQAQGSSSASKDEADGDSENEAQISARRRSNFDSIPLFYVPGGSRQKDQKSRIRQGNRIEEDQLSRRLPEIESHFAGFAEGIPVGSFVHMTKRMCGIPSFFNLPLCKRINERFGDKTEKDKADSSTSNSSDSRQAHSIHVKLNTFLKFWEAEIEPYDRLERFFRAIKQPDAECIYKDDFVPFIQELLHFHPGLDFLDNHEEFQRKYALTVITRIFYKVNVSRTGKLSLKEVRNSTLMNAFMHVDEETDINRVMDFFSYEHFYVLYCRFFELDADKDSKIGREDLLRYGEHSLSEAIVDRIFQVGLRPFSDGREGGFGQTGMSFPDFIFFMLAEEDKSSEAALRYWFVCCDLDGDSRLAPQEMRHFYKVQLHRVTSLGQEGIEFQDVLCQMVDMICPLDSQSITLSDLTKPNKRHISGVLFDVLFNLHKFLRFETRDPFQEKQKRDDVFATDWDRYAYMEYHRLASEEENFASNSNDQLNNMDIDRGDQNINASVGSLSDSDSDNDGDSLEWGSDSNEDDLDDANSKYQDGRDGRGSKGGDGGLGAHISDWSLNSANSSSSTNSRNQSNGGGGVQRAKGGSSQAQQSQSQSIQGGSRGSQASVGGTNQASNASVGAKGGGNAGGRRRA